MRLVIAMGMGEWGNGMETHTTGLLRGGCVSHLSGGEGESHLHPVLLHLRDDQDGRPPNFLTHVVHHLPSQLLAGRKMFFIVKEREENKVRGEKLTSNFSGIRRAMSWKSAAVGLPTYILDE